MGSATTSAATAINTHVSFAPLVRTWQEIVKVGKNGNREYYQQLLDELNSYPELLRPIDAEEVLRKHSSMIDRMLATLFPVTLSDDKDLYAVLQPFNQRVLYASTRFRQLFLAENTEFVELPDLDTAEHLHREKMCGAYQLILNQLYNENVEGRMTSVHHFVCPQTKLETYLELTLDSKFIDVFPVEELPGFSANECGRLQFHHLLDEDKLIKNLPINKFRFEGFVILRITEVTEREIINRIKNNLLNIQTFSDEKIFGELDYLMQNLAGVPQLHTAIKPFFMVNDHLVLSEIITTNKTAKKYPLSQEQQYELYKLIDNHFKTSPETIVVSDINQRTLEDHHFLYILYEHNFKSVIVAPLFKGNKELLGILIVAHRTVALDHEHLAKIKAAIPLFAIALEKSQEQLDHQVDKIIKEQFTAVQSAVEWRFTKAALNQLTKKDKLEQSKIEPIIFGHVYPLYGAIDIRNSSVERNNAIQLDLLEQLQMAGDIIQKARHLANFPLLEELQFRIEKFTDSVSKILFAEEETAVHEFLTFEVVGIMTHLKPILPQLDKKIEDYLKWIESPVRMLYHHRRHYEESITRINTELAMLIDKEQKAAQEIYPHYFERFVTDGLDYNIYVGQSITPRIPFNEFYLKNLKIWQLSVLVRAAQLANSLEAELPLPLKTTQLILAHSNPISISFKTAERKFDVDGAYNIRYEIIKKRIDKVRIKDSNERLTQPGTIAIVYSQNKEALEYLGYIEFLQSKNLLKGSVEKFELEELQGLSGLRGLRVTVNYEGTEELLTNLKSEDVNPMLVLSQA
jgi:hypothetical protein